MHSPSPALAIAWEFRQRHRWGLIALAVYLLALAVTKFLVLGPGHPLRLESGEAFAFVVMMPMTSGMVYFLAVFTFGLSGDLAGRQSMYPARMFTLPITTAELAGWPMLYGTVTVTLLWLAIRALGLWPAGIDVPLIWPAPFAAVLLAWAQVLMWMPYGLRGVRVIVVVLWLTVIDTIVLLALHYDASEAMVVAGLVPQLPLAYLAARFAVARARRGDVPDWRRTPSRIERTTGAPVLRRDNFRSPARAQLWFEWRRHGWSLPVLVAILLPFELALLFAATDAPTLVLIILVGVLLTPPFMAAFTAASVRKSNPYASDSYVVTPFLATRPLTSAALVAAKLKAMMWSTLAAWVLVLVAIPLALVWSDTWPMVSERARAIAAFTGATRAIVILLLILAAFIASTWKQLVQSLYIGLTGREWVMRLSVFLTLSFIVLLGPILQWIIDNRDVQAELWDSLPLVLAILVALKMSAAAVTAVRHYRTPLLSDRTLVVGAGIWCVIVFALYGLLVWILDTPLFPSYFLALVAILAIPLARLSAAPLALAWNRHR
ncbi:MAG: hypothetical protein WD802_11460 [Gemmatimonadaceae bacterium]